MQSKTKSRKDPSDPTSWHYVYRVCKVCNEQIRFTTMYPENVKDKKYRCMKCDIIKQDNSPDDPYSYRAYA